MKNVHFHLPLMMQHEDQVHLRQSVLPHLKSEMVMELFLTFWTSYFVLFFPSVQRNFHVKGIWCFIV